MERVNARIAQLRLEVASLEAEQSASEQALRELEALCRDITGDRAQRETLLTGYQGKTRA